MSFWLNWINKLFFNCLPCKIPARHFQYCDHSQSQIEDGYRKEIIFLLSHLIIHCLYSCCGSLVFTVICCIVFEAVVDPGSLQLFAALSLQLFWILGLYSCECCQALVITFVDDPWSLQLLMLSNLCLYNYLLIFPAL